MCSINHLISLIFLSLATGTLALDQPMGVRFINNNSLPQYVSVDWAAEDLLTPSPLLDWRTGIINPGESLFIPTPPQSSPKFFVGPTPNNKTPEIGSKRDSDTAVEATFAGGGSWTYYDIDIEKGFSVPVWCHGESEVWESGQGCTEDILPLCPDAQRHFDHATGMYDQCVSDDSQEHYEMRQKLCPSVYVRYDDHKTRTIVNHVVKCTIVDTELARSIHVQQPGSGGFEEA